MANGSLSVASRTTSSPLLSMPLIAAHRARRQVDRPPSSSGRTPLFSKVEPASTGKNAPVMTALRTEALEGRYVGFFALR